MSIPSPSFDDFFDAFINELSLSEKPILDSVDEKIKPKAIAIFTQIAARYQSCKEPLTQSSALAGQLTKESSAKIGQLIEKFSKTTNSEEAIEDFKNLCYHLRWDIVNFKDLVCKRSLIEEQGLDSLLNFSWAKNAFKNLLRVKNPWALYKLREWVDHKDDRGLDLLLKECPQEPSLHFLLVEYQENPELVAYVKNKIESDEDQPGHSFGILKIILSQSECEWAQQYLEDHLNQSHPKEAIQKIFARLFLTCRLKFSWIDELIYKAIARSASWAIAMVFNYIDLYPPQRIDQSFIDRLKDFCTGDKEREYMLAAYAVLVQPTNPFKQYFIQHFDHLNKCMEHYEGINRCLEQSDRSEELKGYFIWKNASPDYRINTMRLLIRRDQQLIDVLTQKMSLSDFVDPPVSDCFPKAHSLLVGLRGLRGAEKYVTELSEILSAYDIPVCFPVTQSKDKKVIVEHKNAHPFYSYLTLSRWLRDSSLFHKSSIKIPKVVFNWDEILTDMVYYQGDARIKERLGLPKIKRDFNPIGKVASDQAQLRFLDALLSIDSSLKKVSVQFTYNEGGNVLIGEDEEGPYALVGKDALCLNKNELGEELSARGINKDENSQWIFTKPYEPSQCKLDDEDLRLLFACDLGLGSSKRVYFVEQPDFHLDICCAILSGKRILVNDSMEALEILKKYAKEKLEQASLNPQDHKEYERRLEKLLHICKGRKIYEDMASQDLEDQGFEVIRVGGIFENILEPHSELHQTNFFNFVSLSTPSNKKVVLALGCESFFEEEFKKIVSAYLPDVDIHFINQEESEMLLSEGGGLHCVTKVAVTPFLNSYQKD